MPGDKKPERILFPNGRKYNIHIRGRFEVQPGDFLPIEVGDTVVYFHVGVRRMGKVTKVTDKRGGDRVRW